MRAAAFLSCSDKTHLLKLGRALQERSFQLVATDGTCDFLRREGLSEVTRVSELTGWPEMLGGRVKSLHPAVFGGILADRGSAAHLADMARHNLPNLRVVAVNLYPFGSGGGRRRPLEEAVGLMDVGGVAALRAAAKNFQHVVVLSEPAQYERLDEALASQAARRRLAAAAFEHTAKYDFTISTYLAEEETKEATTPAMAPAMVTRQYSKVADLKYGCNPHQRPAALYCAGEARGGLELLHGKWGFINVLDAVNAWGLAREAAALAGAPVATSFKHTQPAGCAVARPWAELGPASQALLAATFGVAENAPPAVLAYARARNCDPLSSFGDFVGYSGVVEAPLAEFVGAQVSDGIVAAGFTEEALAVLRRKKQGAFVVVRAALAAEPERLELRDVGGGFALAQAANTAAVDRAALTRLVPTACKAIPECSLLDLQLANAALKFAQSNSVAVACDGQVAAVAAGQQSRVDAVRLARDKANVWLQRHSPAGLAALRSFRGARQDRIVAHVRWARQQEGASEGGAAPVTVLASDGFFPFADGVAEALAIGGLRHISQPGGSVRDADSVALCDRHGLTMSMTGIRIFSH